MECLQAAVVLSYLLRKIPGKDVFNDFSKISKHFTKITEDFRGKSEDVCYAFSILPACCGMFFNGSGHATCRVSLSSAKKSIRDKQ